MFLLVVEEEEEEEEKEVVVEEVVYVDNVYLGCISICMFSNTLSKDITYISSNFSSTLTLKNLELNSCNFKNIGSTQ